jgi:hypothetical protein
LPKPLSLPGRCGPRTARAPGQCQDAPGFEAAAVTGGLTLWPGSWRVQKAAGLSPVTREENPWRSFMNRVLARCLALTLIFVGGILPQTELKAASFVLTLQTNGLGTIQRNPTNSVYPAGSVVTLTATPANGWFFSGWTGDESGTTNPVNIQMTTNKAITGNFLATPTYALLALTNGTGSVALSPAGGTYLSNTVVNATAVPAPGWVFVQWAGDASGGSNSIQLTVDRNLAITAIFAQPPAITQPLHNISAQVGANVALTVGAIGTLPLQYQWWFNGVALDGATHTSLNLTNLQLVQEGLYSVVVSNAYGEASDACQLSIVNGCQGTNTVTTASEAALLEAIARGGMVSLCFNGTIALSAEITIDHDVALVAQNRSVILDGNHSNRLFRVRPGVTFSLTNLVLANGADVGQAGVSADTQPPQPGSPGEGGAILSEGGQVRLSGCMLLSNSVAGGMGGAGNASYPTNAQPGDGRGGAILVRGGSLLLDLVSFFGNSATGGPGVSGVGVVWPDTAGGGFGGAVYITDATAVIQRSVLSSNFCVAPGGGSGAAALGGAVFLASGGVLLTNSALDHNMAIGGDSPASFAGFPRPSAAYGGAIAAISGSATMTLCNLISNQAVGGNAFRYSGTGEAQGGAVFSQVQFQASRCGFYFNRAASGNYSSLNTDGRGGAFYNAGPGGLDACAFVSNVAVGGKAGGFGSPQVDFPGGSGQGGGVFNTSLLNLTNCTLALNSAVGGDGGFPSGVPGSGVGGGLCSTNGTTFVVNSTVASNFVTAGQGWTYEGATNGANLANLAGAIALYNSIIAYPSACSNTWGTITDAGFNMVSDGSANLASGSSFNFTDPLLLPVADYGGPTLTMALRSDSPAAGSGSRAGAPDTDQRGLPRPAGPVTDMGAFEFQPRPQELPILTIVSTGGDLSLHFSAEAGIIYVLEKSSTLAAWIEIRTFGPYLVATNLTVPITLGSRLTGFYRLFVP